MWPCSLAFGATWNTHLVKEVPELHWQASSIVVFSTCWALMKVAGAIGREYRGKGANVILGPSVQAGAPAQLPACFLFFVGNASQP